MSHDPDAIPPEPAPAPMPVESPATAPQETSEAAPDPAAVSGLALIETTLTLLQGTLERRLDDLAGRLELRLDGLQSQFDREVRAEASREKVVDRLHAELQEYKQDLLYSLLRPLFLDLIQWHDELGRRAEALVPGTEPDPRLGQLLADLREGIEDLLYRHGVEPFQLDGDQFDPSRQRSLRTVPSTDATRHRTVAGRLRPGFRSGERLIRPELVTVYTPPRPPAD